MFGMVSAFGDCLLHFVVPAAVLLIGAGSKVSRGVWVAAILFALFGFSFSFLANSYNALKVVRELQ